MNTTRNRNFVLILWLDYTDSSTSRAAYLKRKVAEITKEFNFRGFGSHYISRPLLQSNLLQHIAGPLDNLCNAFSQ